MATQILEEMKDDDSDNGNLILSVNNGDYIVLNKIAKEWGFKDREGVIRFALAIFGSTEDKKVYVKRNGETQRIVPHEDLLIPITAELTK